jgi:hypothetical protein
MMNEIVTFDDLLAREDEYLEQQEVLKELSEEKQTPDWSTWCNTLCS